MGEAKRRGTQEERIKQAQDCAATEVSPFTKPAVHLPKSYAEIETMKQVIDGLVASLTTPAEVNSQVAEFAATLSLTAPVFLECRPELWSRQSCCDLNVAEYARLHGGEMLCGYRIWYNGPVYIEAERHAVWTDGHQVRDVSFVDTGETQILFVADNRGFKDAPQKVRHAFAEADQQHLTTFEAMERTIATESMAPEIAWNTMLTYEQWQAGERMPNMFLQI